MRLTVLRTLLVAIVAIVACGASAPVAGASARPAAAVQTVRTYLRAFGAHDAGGVCATFGPALRRWLRGWEPGSSCRARVAAAHFSPGAGGAQVHFVALRSARVSEDRPGIVRVAARIRYRYPCLSFMGPIPGCRPHVESRSDRFYLDVADGPARIVKPGEIYEETSLDAAPSGFDPFTSPADSGTLRGPVRVRSTSALCPAGGRSFSAPRHTLETQSGRHFRELPISAAPWLGIRSVHASWLAGDQLCVAIGLAGPPRPDSSYDVEVDQPARGGSEQDDYSAEFDGLGRARTSLADARSVYRRGRSACPTSVTLDGRQLVLVASPGDDAFDLSRPLRIDVSTESLQPGEPLLAHPLDAQDTVPAEQRSLTLGPPANGLRCRAVGLR